MTFPLPPKASMQMNLVRKLSMALDMNIHLHEVTISVREWGLCNVNWTISNELQLQQSSPGTNKTLYMSLPFLFLLSSIIFRACHESVRRTLTSGIMERERERESMLKLDGVRACFWNMFERILVTGDERKYSQSASGRPQSGKFNYIFYVCIAREQTKIFEMGRYVMAINFEPHSKHRKNN